LCKESKAASAGQNQDHGTNHCRAGTGSCLVLDNGPVDAQLTDIDAKLGLGVPAYVARQQLQNHGNPDSSGKLLLLLLYQPGF
jgi:hypothetical protein